MILNNSSKKINKYKHLLGVIAQKCKKGPSDPTGVYSDLQFYEDTVVVKRLHNPCRICKMLIILPK